VDAIVSLLRNGWCSVVVKYCEMWIVGPYSWSTSTFCLALASHLPYAGTTADYFTDTCGYPSTAHSACSFHNAQAQARSADERSIALRCLISSCSCLFRARPGGTPAPQSRQKYIGYMLQRILSPKLPSMLELVVNQQDHYFSFFLTRSWDE
jgi:hypothetical protein